MKLFFSYFKSYTLQAIRNKSALFFTIAFPSALMLLFEHQSGHGLVDRLGTFIVFANYAVQSTMLISFGLKISSMRNSHWNQYLRTLPVKPSIMLLAGILSILLIAFFSLLLINILALFVYHLPLSFLQLSMIFFTCIVGGIPMAILGYGLGYAIKPDSARQVLVILNLCLLFGAFSFPDHGLLSIIRDFVPSYQWMMMGLAPYVKGANIIMPWIWMLGFTLLFYAFANWAYHRSRNLRQS